MVLLPSVIQMKQCLSPSRLVLLHTTYWFRQQRLMDKRVRGGRWNVLRDGESRPKTYLLTYLRSAEVKTNRSCTAV